METLHKNISRRNENAISTETPGKPLEVHDGLAGKWLHRLRGCCTDQVADIIKTGKVLHEAKADLRGEWVKFKKSSASPYTPRKIEMLMRIAKSSVLCDAQYHALFPEAWTVIYEIAGIPEATLKELIRSGSISPRLTLKRARELNPNYKQRPPKPLSLSGLARIKDRIEESAPYWSSQPDDQAEEVIGCLNDLQEQIKTVKAEFGGRPSV